MKKEPTNIEVDGSEFGNISVSCEYDGARYHFWIRPDTLAPVDGVLFKNPPAGTPHNGPGFYWARRLDQGGTIGRRIMPAMLAAIPAGVPPLKAKWAAADAARLQKAKEERNAANVRAHAAQMLRVLERIAAMDVTNSQAATLARSEAREMVEQVREGLE